MISFTIKICWIKVKLMEYQQLKTFLIDKRQFLHHWKKIKEQNTRNCNYKMSNLHIKHFYFSVTIKNINKKKNKINFFLFLKIYLKKTLNIIK